MRYSGLFSCNQTAAKMAYKTGPIAQRLRTCGAQNAHRSNHKSAFSMTAHL
jgi:hypothetical protein